MEHLLHSSVLVIVVALSVGETPVTMTLFPTGKLYMTTTTSPAEKSLSMTTVSATNVAKDIKDMSFTVETLNKTIGRLLMHKDKIPALMVELIEKTTEQEKEEFVAFVNKLRRGDITLKAKNVEELIEFIQENVPSIGEKARTLHEDYKKRVEQLTPQAQEFVKRWEETWFKSVDKLRTDRRAFIEDMIKLIPQYLGEITTFNEETWKTLEEQFPERMKFWNENKEKLVRFKELLKKMKPEDIEKLKRFEEAMKRVTLEEKEKFKDAMESMRLKELFGEAFGKFTHLGLDELLPSEALHE